MSPLLSSVYEIGGKKFVKSVGIMDFVGSAVSKIEDLYSGHFPIT